MAGRNLLAIGTAPGRDLIGLAEQEARPDWFNEAAAHASNLRGRATPDAYPGMFDNGEPVSDDEIVRRLAKTELAQGENARQLTERVFGRPGAAVLGSGGPPRGRNLLDIDVVRPAKDVAERAEYLQGLLPGERRRVQRQEAGDAARTDAAIEAAHEEGSKGDSSWWETFKKTGQNLDDLIIGRGGGGLLASVPQALKMALPGGALLPETGVDRTIEKTGQGIFDRATAEIGRNQPVTEFSPGKRFASDLVNAFANLATGVAVAAATKNPMAGASIIGAQVFGDRYGQSRSEGRTDQQAFADASWYAAAELIPEAKVLGEIIKPGGRLLFRIGKGAVAEGIQESVTQVLQDGYAKGVLKEDMTWGDVMNNVAYAGLLGLTAGGGVAAEVTAFSGERAQQRQAVNEMAGVDIADPGAALDALSPDQDGIRPAPFRQPQAPGMIEAANVRSDPTPDDEASPLPTDLIAQGKALMEGATAKLGADAILDRNSAPRTGTQVELMGQAWTVEDAFTDNGEEGLTLSRGGQKQKVYFSDLADAGIALTPVVAQPAPEVTTPEPQISAVSTPQTKAESTTPSLPSDIIGFFAGRGYSEAQARGIAAGIVAESRADHTIINPTSGAFGIGQWLGSRKAELLRRYGQSPTREQQLEYLDWELKGGDVGGEAVLAATDEAGVLDAYIKKFMRPAAGAETTGDIERGTAALGGGVDLNVNLEASNDGGEASNRTSFLDEKPEQDQPLRVELPPARDIIAEDADKGDGTPQAPRQIDDHSDIDRIVDRVELEPTDGQAEAGNYRKAHLKLHGMDITVENPKGSTRSGVSPEGVRWTATIPATYGYVKRTTGADGDHSDVYIGPNPASPIAFVIDQYDPKTRKFDETKTVLGVDSEAEARAIYDAGFSDGSGPTRRGGITQMPVDQFKEWVSGEQLEPAAPGVLPTESAASLPAAVAPAQAGVETGGPGASPAPVFDPLPHVKALREYVGGKGSLQPAAIAKALKLSDEDANRVLGALAAQPNAPIRITRGRPEKRNKLDKVIQTAVPSRIIRRAVRRGPVDVLTFLHDRGGIRDDEGHDLYKGRGLGRRLGLIRKNGRSIDDVGELLHDAGYFTQRPTVAEVLELLDRAATRKVYRPEEGVDADQAAREREGDVEEGQVRTEIVSTAQQWGLTFRDHDADAALDYVAGGDSVELAIQRAMDDAAVDSLDHLEDDTANSYYLPDPAYEGEEAEQRGGADDTRTQANADREAPQGVDRSEGVAGSPARGGDPDAQPDRAAEAGQGEGRVAINPAAARAAAKKAFPHRIPAQQHFERGFLAEQGDTHARAALIDNYAEKEGAAAAREAPEAEQDMFGTRPGDERTALQRKGEGRLQSDKEQKAPGSDGGLFDDNSARQADIEDAGASTQPRTAPIEDFGEELLGARKHYAQAYQDKMDKAGEVDIAAEPLAKSWPEPDYAKLIEGGADAYTVAWIHAARDEIPTKPSKSWKLKGWVENVRTLRGFAENLLSGETSAEDVRSAMRKPEFSALRDLAGRVDLYLEVGHDASLKGVTLRNAHYSLYRGEKDVTKWTVEQRSKATAFGNWPRELAVADTREEVLRLFKERLAGGLEKRARSGPKFEIYSRRDKPGQVFIGVKIGKETIDLKEFPDVAAARAFKGSEEGYAELEAALAKFKYIPPERREFNSPRIGENHRNGADVTPEQFSETFGFRGVQFGNYVEGPRRQADLNEAYDALMDMAGVLGIPPKAISLNGGLGLAFGARGKGGKGAPAAHYEPGTVVINLTKTQGAGSLAHEWWHALDNYFARSGGGGGYMTAGAKADGVREVVAEAFRNVIRTVKGTALQQRSRNLDKRRTKDYWSTDIEMTARAFESYMIARLGESEYSNDYLANIVSEQAWPIENGYPYLTAAEIPVLRAAYDDLFDKIEVRGTERGQELYDIADGRNFLVDESIDAVGAQLGGVRKALEEQFARSGLKDKVFLNVADRLFDDRRVAGSYLSGVISVALDSVQNPAVTLSHETVHALRDLGLIKPAEWAALTKAARADTKLMNGVIDRYSPTRLRRMGMEPLTDEQLVEEAIADMYAAWAAGDRTEKGFIRDAFQRVLDFLQALGAALRGRLPSAETVMRAIERGDIGGRQELSASDRERLMVAWHGTPHDFDAFSTEAMGTGEGNQSFGWGLYFAGKKEVAEHYRRKLATSKSEVRWNGMTIGELGANNGNALSAEQWDMLEALAAVEQAGDVDLALVQLERRRFPSASIGVTDWLHAHRDEIAIKNSGHLYEVDIPEEHEYLLWDKGLSEQPDQVKEALAKIPEPVMDSINDEIEERGMNPIELDDDAYTGMHLYRMLVRYSTEGALNEDYMGDDPKEDVSRFLHRRGIAGIKYLDGGSRGAGDGTHNYVVFDGARVKVLEKFSLAENPDAHLAGPASPTVADLAESDPSGNRFAETFDRWREALQDRMLPLLRTQQRVERALGRPLDEEENAYLGEELLTGKVGAQLERLSDELVAPMFEAMKEDGVSVEELTSYVYARHAPERNAQMAKINPEFAEGGGSGMSDVEAAAIVARAKKAGRTDALGRAAERLDMILASARRTRLEAGLLSQEEYDAWESTYDHYVPLRGQAELDSDPNVDRPRKGSGISVKGKESKRAFGRRSKAEDILAYSILQAEEAIIRAETNRVGQQFLTLARANPDADFWQVDKIERRPVMNKATGQVQYQEQSRISAEDAPFTVSVKVGGEEHRVTMNRNNPAAARLADAMRNLTGHQFWPIVGFFGKFTRAFSALATRWNPPFVVVNAMRDVQTASVTLLQHDQKGLVRGVLKDWRKALVAPKKGDGEWAKWRREFELAGGKVYFNDIGDINDIKKRIDRQVSVGTASALSMKSMAAGFFKAVEFANDHVENAVRLAAYKNARQAGLSKAQAASIARNVTVNFTRRGKFGPVINAAYAFFNASTQGSATLITAAVKSKKVRGAMLGFMVAGFALDMLNAMLSDDDDDGESFWAKIPEHEKRRNLILIIPGGKGDYIKLPIGLGLNALFNAGRTLSEASRGARSPLSAAGEATGGFVDAFNPIGAARSLTSFILPTILDPAADLQENRNFADSPIQPDQSPFDPPVTPSSNYFPSVSPIAQAMTDAVNKATGGDEVRPGAVSVSPEVVEYLATYFTAGAGKFVSDVASLAMAPGDATIQDVPFVNRVAGTTPRWIDKSAFYARIEDVEQTVGYLKEYKKGGDREGFEELKGEKSDLLGLVPLVKAARKEMRSIRSARAALELAHDQDRIDDGAYATDKAVLDGAEDVVISVFNKRYLETVAEPVGAE